MAIQGARFEWLGVPENFRNCVIEYNANDDGGFHATVRRNAATKDDGAKWLCDFELRTKTKWRDGLPGVVELRNVQNYSLKTAAALLHLPPTDESRQQFEEYLANGMGVCEAVKYHMSVLELRSDVSEALLADGSVNPNYSTVRWWYDKWRRCNLGPWTSSAVLKTKCSETDLAVSAPAKTRKVEIDESGLSSDFPNIKWLKIEEFSPEKEEDKIHEFVKTWLSQDCWLYSVNLISIDELEFDTRYRYQIRFSIPTVRDPFPRATASVYTTIEVSKITPKDFPVSVYFVIEGNRLAYRPGQIRFEEKWLKDMIESKILLLKASDF